MRREYAKRVVSCFVARLSGRSRTLGVLLIASGITVATAQAQSTLTAPSNTSRSGIQSVITQRRDALQRGKSTESPRSPHQQSAIKKPVVPSTDR